MGGFFLPQRRDRIRLFRKKANNTKANWRGKGMHGAAAIRAVLLLVVCLGRRDGRGRTGKGRQAEAMLGA